jgi:flagellar biogenesis protein FliO
MASWFFKGASPGKAAREVPFFFCGTAAAVLALSGLAGAAEPSATRTPSGYLAQSINQLQGQDPLFQAPSLFPELLKIAFSLAAVLALVYVCARLYRRWLASRGAGTGPQAERLIQVLDRRFLDSKRGLAVVDMGGEILFVGLGEGVTLLHRVEDPQKVESLRQAAASQAFFKGFPEQLDRISTLLRSNQWKKNRQSLKSQSEFLKEQAERLKPLSEKDKP